MPSRAWCDDAALLKIVSSWLRPGAQAATALTACVTAARSVPLWASNAARACAACRRGGSAGEDAREDTAEGAGLSASTRATNSAISSAARGIVSGPALGYEAAERPKTSVP